MAKYKIAYALSAVALIAGSGIFVPTSYAEGITTVSTADEFAMAVLEQAPYIKLANDLTVSSCVNSDSNWLGYFDITTTLDLDGHTITQAEGCPDFYVRDGGDLTITGGGKIVKGYQNDDSDVFYVIGSESRGGGRLTIEDAEISGDGYAVRMTGPSTELNVNGGKITSNGYGVAAFGPAIVTVDGGEINAGTFALTGNGLSENAGAAFYIRNGRVISDTDYAIYLPQVDGVLEISGGEVSGAAGAIAANRGAITVSGGELTSLGTAVVSGDVSQDGTRGYGNAVIGIAKEYGPVTLNISGGTFINQNGAELIADVSGLDNENEAIVEITGGQFTVAPNESEIENPDENEADIDEETGMYTIFPKRTDMKEQGVMESDDSKYGAVAGSATFTQEFITDRKAYFEISTLDENEFSILVFEDVDGELVAGFDVSLWNRDGVAIDVHGTEAKVKIALTNEQYSKLAAYDKVVMINYDEQGNEVERFDAVLGEEDGVYYVEFTTTHMSTYAVAGVNSTAEDTTDGAAVAIEASTPETGTVTREGASAMSAALITAIAVGLLVSIVSFAVLIRRK